MNIMNILNVMSFKRELKIIGASVFCGLLITLAILSWLYSEQVSSRIAEKFIRLHVIANSDSYIDQSLKLKVRDGVLKALQEPLSGCETISSARETLITNLPQIEQSARQTLLSEGYNYPVRATLARTMFPTRQYGDVTLVAGMYEALRVEIGESAGKNWWCVVYPPLCYVDVSKGSIPDSVKSELKNELAGDYKFVAESETELPVKIKFKVVELWQESKTIALAALKK